MLVNDCTAKTWGRFKCPCCKPDHGLDGKKLRRRIKRAERQRVQKEMSEHGQ